jgi:hypothetical protein
VVEVTTYTVTAERGQRRWSLQCDEVPGAISEVTRLDQAEDVMREAIAFVADVDEADVEVTLHIVLPSEEYREHQRRAARLREDAKLANEQAALEARRAATALRDDGLSVRDIGTVLGVSHQRAQQLIAAQ